MLDKLFDGSDFLIQLHAFQKFVDGILSVQLPYSVYLVLIIAYLGTAAFDEHLLDVVKVAGELALWHVYDICDMLVLQWQEISLGISDSSGVCDDGTLVEQLSGIC